MKTIIAGSRSLPIKHDKIWLVADAVHKSGWFHDISEIVSGGARGIDLAGEMFAENYSIPIKRFIPEWSKEGKGAGPIRNAMMADYVAPDGALILIWTGLSKGSAHMKKEAQKRNLKIYEYLVT